MTAIDFLHLDALVRAAREVLTDFFARPGYSSDENHWWIEQDAGGMIEITIGICDQTYGVAISGFTSYGEIAADVDYVVHETKQLLVRAFSDDAKVRGILGLEAEVP